MDRSATTHDESVLEQNDDSVHNSDDKAKDNDVDEATNQMAAEASLDECSRREPSDASSAVTLNKVTAEDERLKLLAKRSEMFIVKKYMKAQENLSKRLQLFNDQREIERLDRENEIKAQELKRKIELDKQQRMIQEAIDKLDFDKQMAILDSQISVYGGINNDDDDNEATGDDDDEIVFNYGSKDKTVKFDTGDKLNSKPDYACTTNTTCITENSNDDSNSQMVAHSNSGKVFKSYHMAYTEGPSSKNTCMIGNVNGDRDMHHDNYMYCDNDVNNECSNDNNRVMSRYVKSDDSIMKCQAGKQPESSSDILQELLHASKLPTISLDIFDGNSPLKYSQWRNAFASLIECSTRDPVRRMAYLNQYTSGSANLLIQGFMCNPSIENYCKAIQSLDKQYGSSIVLAKAYMDAVDDHRVIPSNDINALQSFANLLCTTQNAMNTLRQLHQLETDFSMQRIIIKLPPYMQTLWRQLVFEAEEKGQNLNFDSLVKFIQREMAKSRHPVYSVQALSAANTTKQNASNRDTKGKKTHIKTFSTVVETSNEKPKQSWTSGENSERITTCLYCERKRHIIDKCRKFLALDLSLRQKWVKEKRLCFGCLKVGSKDHGYKNCKHPLKCQKCNLSHPTSLHDDNRAQHRASASNSASDSPCDQTETAVKSVVNCANKVDVGKVFLPSALVNVRIGSKVIQTYCVLDTMSMSTFISKELYKQLNAVGKSVKINLTTMNSECEKTTKLLTDLYVSPHEGGHEICVPEAYVQDVLPVSSNDLVTHDDICKYTYLSELISEVTDRIIGLNVGILIGLNCPQAFEPLKCINSALNGPLAVKTKLGWVFVGGNSTNSDKASVVSSSCNYLSVHESDVYDTNSVPDMLNKLYMTDFVESVYKNDREESKVTSITDLDFHRKPYSCNDRKFLSLMKKEGKLEEGHYVLPLALKSDDITLPNNKIMALKRLSSLKLKLQRDTAFKAGYTEFMNEMLDKGYARLSDKQEIDSWYLPHHAVHNPHKPDKFRVVFDASAEYRNCSLNKALLSGPDLTNSLVGVLLRFRQESVAIMADIKSMFYQVKVPEVQQKYLKFLWWPGGDLNRTPVDHQMTVHLFGATSSPSTANFALHMTAVDNEAKFGPEASRALHRNFYVDDLLKSVKDVETAKRLTLAIYELCKLGGFHLTKFASNDIGALSQIPIEDRTSKTDRVDLIRDPGTVHSVLGVCWSTENDVIGYRLSLPDKPVTRRGILSVISSIFDPLGLISPFLLKGKLILQKLCQMKLDWDTIVDNDSQQDWMTWKNTMSALHTLQIPRCYRRVDMADICSVSLHHFSDASQIAYGVCSYLRLADTEGKINCMLIMAKSRVAPGSTITVPRLELTAATVAVKLGMMLTQELDYKDIRHYYWTDSTAVLGYIANEARRYHVFVANRVQYIRDNSQIANWKYIKSADNPADDASRGLSYDKVSLSHRWFRGPDILWISDEDLLCADTEPHFVSDNDKELKAVTSVRCTAVVVTPINPLEEWFKHFSNWIVLKRRFAWLQLVFSNLKNKNKPELIKDLKLPLTVSELRNAEIGMYKYIQDCTFADEIQSLKANEHVSLKSKLYKLRPVLAPDGLLRIGGRLGRSSLKFDGKHPIILPSEHHVIEVLVSHYHEISYHSGKEFVLASLRRNFWILGARRLLIKVRQKCFTCKRHFDKPMNQLMSDLPEDRLVSGLPPFTNVGVDFFGPLYVKVGRSLVKRYGCIFTCLTMRAVHIEVVYNMDTDSFINALERFIARRGVPKIIRSDNGSNLIGAQRELRDSIRNFNGTKMTNFCQNKEINWIFNPPYASHMGGVWERQIRSVRRVLSTIMKIQHLNDESLYTLLCIVEYTINSRPLTAVSNDPTDLDPLTPNDLLQLKQMPRYPPGTFVKQDSFGRRRWRQIQYLADVFWKRWSAEYIPNLQARSKWNVVKPSLEVHDLVLVADSSVPRYTWTVGRVIRTIPSKDGLVRTVEIKTKQGNFVKPIHKLCLLEKCCT